MTQITPSRALGQRQTRQLGYTKHGRRSSLRNRGRNPAALSRAARALHHAPGRGSCVSVCVCVCLAISNAALLLITSCLQRAPNCTPPNNLTRKRASVQLREDARPDRTAGGGERRRTTRQKTQEKTADSRRLFFPTPPRGLLVFAHRHGFALLPSRTLIRSRTPGSLL